MDLRPRANLGSFAPKVDAVATAPDSERHSESVASTWDDRDAAPCGFGFF